MDALRAIDAAHGVERLGFPMDAISFINDRGRSLGRMPMAGPREDGQSSIMLRRAELYGALGETARVAA